MVARVVTQPTNSVVTRAEVKRQLRIADADTTHDVDVDDALTAAIAEIDATGRLGRAMITQDVEQLSAPRACDWELEITPVQSVVSIEVRDAAGAWVDQGLVGFDLITDGDRYWLRAEAWPSGLAARPDALKVTYRAGFGDTAESVPADLRRAVCLLAAHRFEIREEVIAGQSLAVVPNGVDAIVSRHRIRTFT